MRSLIPSPTAAQMQSSYAAWPRGHLSWRGVHKISCALREIPRGCYHASAIKQSRRVEPFYDVHGLTAAFAPASRAHRKSMTSGRSRSATVVATHGLLMQHEGADIPNSSVLSYLPSAEADTAEPGTSIPPRQLPRAVESPADNPLLANPLERQNRLGTGWMGVILEYEGVAVDDCADLHTRAWQQLAAEEGRTPVPHWALRRAEGMKNEQVVQEVLLWSRQPMEVRRLCARKEEMFRELRGSFVPALPPGTSQLLAILAKNDVPVALACSAPEARVKPTLQAVGLLPHLAAVITAEDVARGRPDPEAVLYAAQQLQRPPIRCVLIGNSNASVESARECGMAVVAVAGRTPVYELTAADLVVRSLSELSFVNLKQLFGREAQVAFETELELGPDTPHSRAQTMLLDN